MDTFFIIPHTHWEGAVFKTREEYLDMGLPNILKALQLLKIQPSYRFVLDQACYVRPFLERYPEEVSAFLQFIREGRLEIVGGLDVMVDANIPCGESFIRQVLYGKGYFRRELGVEVLSGWLLDTFGQNAQMPQLFRLSGYTNHWFWRGAPSYDVPAEFLWKGIDGTCIPAYWLPYGYGNAYHSPQNPPEFRKFFTDLYDRLEPFAGNSNLVALSGVDVGEPEEHLVGMADQYNRDPDDFQLKVAVPGEYVRTIESSASDRPVLGGEWNPIFQGGYSSRIRLKQYTREIERLLLTTEKLSALLLLVHEIDDLNLIRQNIWAAWEPALFNQAHDLMSGVMTDHVYEDTLSSYEFSQRIAGSDLTKCMALLADRIDTSSESGSGTASMVPTLSLVVFNPSGFNRSEMVSVEVGFGNPDMKGVRITTTEGQPVPVQMMDAGYDSQGTLLVARIAFIANDVPAMGYRVFHLTFTEEQNPYSVEEEVSPLASWLENEFYHLEVDPSSGAITRLHDKENDWEVISGHPGNVVVMEEDHGDLWELYRPLDGGSTIAMQEPHPAPEAGKAMFSTDPLAAPGSVQASVHRGPVYSEMVVKRTFSNLGKLETRVRLVSGSRRIDFHTRILNQDRFVRYRVLFPTSLSGGLQIHEIPFGAIERPEGIEFPAQNWIETGGDKRGVALLNRGLPGNNISEGVLMLSLLRSTRIVAYGFFGGYEEGMSSDSGFELGKEHSFEYALLPHSGDWQDAGVVRQGQAFNNPLIVQKEPLHSGDLPASWGSLVISHPGIILSALKPGEDGGIVLRVYESSGRETRDVWISFNERVICADIINLMEDTIQPLELQNGRIKLDFHPFEIKTVKLVV